MTCGGRALVCATLQEANWSRSSSCWDMSRFKRPSDTLAASSGFGRRSMIASESNQIAESPGGSGRVADHAEVARVSLRCAGATYAWRGDSCQNFNEGGFPPFYDPTDTLWTSSQALNCTPTPLAVATALLPLSSSFCIEDKPAKMTRLGLGDYLAIRCLRDCLRVLDRRIIINAM